MVVIQSSSWSHTVTHHHHHRHQCVIILSLMMQDRNKVKHVTDLGILAMLLEALDNQEFKSTVFVIGIASDVTSLDSSLLQPGIYGWNYIRSSMLLLVVSFGSCIHIYSYYAGRLEVIIRFASPGLNQRRMILQNLISRLPLCSQENNDEDNETRSKPTASLLDILTRWTRGYGRADLGRLCSEAMAVAWSRKRKQLKDTDGKISSHICLISRSPFVFCDELNPHSFMPCMTCT